MSQAAIGTINPATESGSALSTRLNNFGAANNTTQSGSSRPSHAVAGTLWLDTTTSTAWALKVYDGTSDVIVAYLNSSTHLLAMPAFRAHKNATAQTGIADNTATKVTFGTEVFDVGSFYDTTNSRWTPPAGRYVLTATIRNNGTSIADGDPVAVMIYKNGSLDFDFRSKMNGTQPQGHSVMTVVEANGTDYFEVYYLVDTTSGSATQIDGTAAQTVFAGYAI
jgi:hypothetical protein